MQLKQIIKKSDTKAGKVFDLTIQSVIGQSTYMVYL
jgi:hypothetical protein